jgi:hypothetical protein
MSSAVCTACALSALDVARLNSSVRASGEFIVIVVAVCMRAVSSHSSLERTNKQRTERASHGADPTFFAAASVRRRSYTERMCGGAGRVLGRAKGAAMRAFSAGESFDMRIYILYIEISVNQPYNGCRAGCSGSVVVCRGRRKINSRCEDGGERESVGQRGGGDRTMADARERGVDIKYVNINMSNINMSI